MSRIIADVAEAAAALFMVAIAMGIVLLGLLDLL
jgi:hypothetical protein